MCSAASLLVGTDVLRATCESVVQCLTLLYQCRGAASFSSVVSWT